MTYFIIGAFCGFVFWVLCSLLSLFISRFVFSVNNKDVRKMSVLGPLFLLALIGMFVIEITANVIMFCAEKYERFIYWIYHKLDGRTKE